MKSLAHGVLLGAMVVGVSGCCSNVTTDPREGGLAGGVCGTATGAYDQRVAALERQADSLDAANARLESSLQTSRSERARLDSVIAAKRRDLSSARAKLAVLSRDATKRQLVAEITQLKAATEASDRRIMAIEKGVASARSESVVDRARREAGRVSTEDILARIEALEKQSQ